MTNKENFLKLVSGKDTEIAKEIAERRKNKDVLRASGRIALKVRSALKEKGMSLRDLATLLEVSPQYVSKLVKGKENLTLDTITRLQKVLNIEILLTPKNEKVLAPMTIVHVVYDKIYATNNCTDYNHTKNIFLMETCN